MPLTIYPGEPFPLGATPDANGSGTNFSVFSQHATRVDLCLYDATGKETQRTSLRETTFHVHHGYLPGVQAGQRYGYRAWGAYAPLEGHRFNPTKLLLDPYARAIDGGLDPRSLVFGYRLGAARQDLTRDNHNSAPAMPKCVVVDDRAFDWQGDRPPNIPWAQTVIYEAHVKGLTMQHPDVPPELRGTYLGVASAPVIQHLRNIGVTAVELLPIHHFVDEGFLLDKGLVNYWGYNSIGFFAPADRYANPGGVAGAQVAEFKTMVRALHAAGIEVILDVVYNHTAEGDHLGPTLGLKGLDNTAYYNLVPDQRRFYLNFTGTGNTLNVHHPQTLRLITDSLRYWVEVMHVDGFRFDLAVTLGRDPLAFDRGAGFFDAIHQDPVLSRVKLIAEPWDVGDFGYQVGNFPVIWSEWNGKYRDNVRKFWKGDSGQVAELAYRLTGSSDLYRLGGRWPYASVNLVTTHDGFSLRDLVSYNEKHNEANGENNQDGANDNHSWNCGAEGLTDDPTVNELRGRQQRNFLATLFLSQGVPMLVAGDELSRTQAGNNNAYCQDNEISWVSWHVGPEEQRLLAFTRRLAQLRQEHPVLRRPKFFEGLFLPGADIKDLSWFAPDGTELKDDRWNDPEARSLGMRLAGPSMDERDEHGARVTDDTLLVLMNAFHQDLEFVLPPTGAGPDWELLLDTRELEIRSDSSATHTAGGGFPLGGRTLALFRARRGG